MKKKAAEYDAVWNNYLRTCAEFENARRRWDREKQEIFKLGNFSLIGDIIVILDELEHALQATKEHYPDSEIGKGIELTYTKFADILARHGLKRIDAQGKKFDPHLFEIVGQRDTNEWEEHIVIEEVQKGYFLEDKVLRTSKVIVAVRMGQEEGSPKTE